MFANVVTTLSALGLATFLASYAYYLSTKTSTFSRLSSSTKMGFINWWETKKQYLPINKQVLHQRALQEEKNKKYYNYDEVGGINLAEIHHLQYFTMKELEQEDDEFHISEINSLPSDVYDHEVELLSEKK